MNPDCVTWVYTRDEEARLDTFAVVEVISYNYQPLAMVESFEDWRIKRVFRIFPPVSVHGGRVRYEEPWKEIKRLRNLPPLMHLVLSLKEEA